VVGFTLFVPMKPVPKARARVTRSGHAYTPATTVAAEKLIRGYFKLKYPGYVPLQEVPLAVDVLVFFLRPKCRKKLDEKYHTVKPDADNLCKLPCDALNGIAWVDDCLIAELSCSKIYCDDEEKQGILIRCEVLSNDAD